MAIEERNKRTNQILADEVTDQSILANGTAIEGAVAIQKRHERTDQIERGMADTTTDEEEFMAYRVTNG